VDLGRRAASATFLIRDRAGQFPTSCDAVFQAEAVRILASPLRAPTADASCEKVIGALRRELPRPAADRQRAPLAPGADGAPAARQHRPAAPRPRPARTGSELTPGHRKSTSPNTGSAENKSSADSPMNTRSPPDSSMLLRQDAGHHPRLCIRAQQVLLCPVSRQRKIAPHACPAEEEGRDPGVHQTLPLSPDDPARNLRSRRIEVPHARNAVGPGSRASSTSSRASLTTNRRHRTHRLRGSRVGNSGSDADRERGQRPGGRRAKIRRSVRLRGR
jgi:hypothetical protein